MNKHTKTHAWTINKDAKMQTNEESQTRWHKASIARIKEAKHVIT